MNSTLFFTLIIFIIFVSLLSLVSSRSQQDVFPDHYFINCGSNLDIEFTGKKFLKDENGSTFSVSGGSAARNNRNPEPEIYQTARVFTEKSGYELEAYDNNTVVVVRLYFSPFMFNGLELSSSKFEVSVLGFTLLSDFSVGNGIVMKEFIAPIGDNQKFKIEFIPSNSSFPAFVNAIEAFTVPKELFKHGGSLPRVSPEGGNGDMESITSSFAFNPIYRINVGGERVGVEGDRLRRTWIPDAPFIFTNRSARNASLNGQFSYNNGSAAENIAPYDVYSTAKQLTNSLVNITWRFDVSKSSMYLVRAHFCNIIGLGYSDDAFNFFVYSHFKQVIPPGNRTWELYLPFYADFVVDSVRSEVLNVSIGAITGNNKTAFLNGLEIMKLLRCSGVDQNGGKKNKKVYIVMIVVGCIIGGVVLALVLLLGFFIGSKYGKAKPAVEGKPESNVVPSCGRSSYTSISIDFTMNHPSPIPKLNLNLRFPFADILQATNGFDEKLMIGKGGFGKVYKGTLPNGMIVAVKRGEKGHGQGRPEFVTEIMVLSKIRHHHLVTLIGYCDERSEMILVYEFMEKGTLQDHLYDCDENLPKLSWDQRLEICISAARGLHYLHTGSDTGIIHRDVKSTNILLNEKYVAKVADFGISRLDNVDESDITDIKGSFGYLDPEYISCMKLTQKSDVYSFGVVLLEVLCARPALDNTLPQKEANLADWAITQINNGMVETIIDPFLVGKINPNSLRKFLETVQRCLKDTADERPNMIDVLWDLEYALKLQQMVADKEPYEDSTMNTSLELPMSMIHRLPSNINDHSEVNDRSALSYPSESQVFSQLNIHEAR